MVNAPSIVVHNIKMNWLIAIKIDFHNAVLRNISPQISSFNNCPIL